MTARDRSALTARRTTDTVGDGSGQMGEKHFLHSIGREWAVELRRYGSDFGARRARRRPRRASALHMPDGSMS